MKRVSCYRLGVVNRRHKINSQDELVALSELVDSAVRREKYELAQIIQERIQKLEERNIFLAK